MAEDLKVAIDISDMYRIIGELQVRNMALENEIRRMKSLQPPLKVVDDGQKEG